MGKQRSQNKKEDWWIFKSKRSEKVEKQKAVKKSYFPYGFVLPQCPVYIQH